jgi:hypothetical protein
VVTSRGRKGRTRSSVRDSIIAFSKIIALLAVCYIWKYDPSPDAKYYLGAIVALAIPIPRRKNQ